MRRRDFTRGLAQFLTAGSLLPITVATAADDNSIAWHHELGEASRQMQAERRPLLLFVTMDGCHHCRRMKSRTYQDERVVRRIRESYVAAAFNGPRQPELARRLNVRVYPSTVIISPEFQVVETIRGYVAADELSLRLTELSQNLVARAR